MAVVKNVDCWVNCHVWIGEKYRVCGVRVI